jgi:DNA-binding CsgD family transcriptional regulator
MQQGWIEGKPEVADEIFQANVALHVPVGDAQGTAILKAAAADVHALEDLTCTCELTGMDGDHFVLAFTIRGRHVKPYLGAPPNGRILECRDVGTVRMEGARIAEVWQTGTSRYLDEGEEYAQGETVPALQEPWAKQWQLTPREQGIADLLMKGYPDKRIAAELDLAVASVRKYVTRILAKAGAPSRTQLAEHAGLIRLG